MSSRANSSSEKVIGTTTKPHQQIVANSTTLNDEDWGYTKERGNSEGAAGFYTQESVFSFEWDQESAYNVQK